MGQIRNKPSYFNKSKICVRLDEESTLILKKTKKHLSDFIRDLIKTHGLEHIPEFRFKLKRKKKKKSNSFNKTTVL